MVNSGMLAGTAGSWVTVEHLLVMPVSLIKSSFKGRLPLHLFARRGEHVRR